MLVLLITIYLVVFLRTYFKNFKSLSSLFLKSLLKEFLIDAFILNLPESTLEFAMLSCIDGNEKVYYNNFIDLL